MNSSYLCLLYIITIIFLTISLISSKEKTKMALKKALKMLLNTLPQFLFIILVVGLLLTLIDSKTIELVIGSSTGMIGMLVAAIGGSIALIPVLVVFPIAAELIQSGAGIMQVTVFIMTLTTVGLITLPLESKYLGKKVARLRNGLFFISSFIVAIIMGVFYI